MTRLSSGVLLAALCFGGATALIGVAHAQTQAEIAAQLNEEGKELAFAGKVSEASAKFREAVARVPEPKYFYNLCGSLFAEGKFDEALTACNAVGANNPDATLKGKADTLVGKIDDEAKKQGIELHPGGGGGDGEMIGTGSDAGSGTTVSNPQTTPTNPGNPQTGNPQTGNPQTGNPQTGNPQYAQNPPYPPPNPQTGAYPPPRGGYTPAVGRPPTENLFRAVQADNNYTWTLGVDLYAGGSSIGHGYGNTSAGVRVKADYLINRAARFGAEGYIQYTNISSGDSMAGVQTAPSLQIVDIGGALYKHFCLHGTPRLCLTPLGGVQLALMNPLGTDADGSSTFNYAAVGFRAELAAQYAFGIRFQNVLSVGVGVNAYTKVLSDPSDGSPTAMDVGLDAGGAAGYLSIGYTYRFNTPLGGSPFVVFE